MYNLYNNKTNWVQYTVFLTQYDYFDTGACPWGAGGGWHISCPSSPLLHLTSRRIKARNITSIRVSDSHCDLSALGLMRGATWRCSHSRCILLTNYWKLLEELLWDSGESGQGPDIPQWSQPNAVLDSVPNLAFCLQIMSTKSE